MSTLLDTIEGYEYSNVASQLGIQVLDQLKTSFDDGDLETLKAFVRKHLSTVNATHLRFESGRLAHRGHLAAIIKMALELKKLTLEGGLIDVVSNKRAAGNSEEVQNELERQLKAQILDAEWTKFCSGPLRVHETKWNKRLEEYKPEDHQHLKEH